MSGFYADNLTAIADETEDGEDAAFLRDAARELNRMAEKLALLDALIESKLKSCFGQQPFGNPPMPKDKAASLIAVREWALDLSCEFGERPCVECKRLTAYWSRFNFETRRLDENADGVHICRACSGISWEIGEKLGESKDTETFLVLANYGEA